MFKPVIILGIDTSCDDTSAAVVRDGSEILSDIVSSQADIHRKYGGIVPELASRKHVEMIWPVVHEALTGAQASLDTISAVAVCYGPGLIGSLLVGCLFAKSLCYSKQLPLIGVNHLEGHVFTPFLAEKRPAFPFLSLVVSGGHTSLYRVNGFRQYIELGRTRDDAAGEAYDKVAKMLGLGYPGAPAIDRLADQGNPKAVDFPRPYLPESLDFSFSGLKTAVRNFLFLNQDATEKKHPARTEDICASFQAAMVDVLVRKTEWALKKEGIQQLALAGGVAANRELSARMKEMTESNGIELFLPSASLCTDNAAMIAAAGYFHYINKDFSDLTLNPSAYLPLGS
ncbi:MAG: tRNA (adenosine(37)-N6)-threonylcarbamoyltransferase complex transferase subunit TsaD [bacterium]